MLLLSIGLIDGGLIKKYPFLDVHDRIDAMDDLLYILRG